MQKLTIDSSLIGQLTNLHGPVELVDAAGHAFGRFIPELKDDCPYSQEEIATMLAAPGERPLADLWKQLGVK